MIKQQTEPRQQNEEVAKTEEQDSVKAGARGESLLPCDAQEFVKGGFYNMNHKIRMLAGEALAWFEYRKRHDETGCWAVEGDAPE